jgi:hypothetical protein
MKFFRSIDESRYPILTLEAKPVYSTLLNSVRFGFTGARIATREILKS